MGTKIENETIINFNEEEEDVSIYTASSPIRRKCEKLGFTLVKTDCLANTHEECSWWFKCKKDDFRFGKRKKSGMTLEQREISRVSMMEMQKRQKEQKMAGSAVAQPTSMRF